MYGRRHETCCYSIRNSLFQFVSKQQEEDNYIHKYSVHGNLILTFII